MHALPFVHCTLDVYIILVRYHVKTQFYDVFYRMYVDWSGTGRHRPILI